MHPIMWHVDGGNRPRNTFPNHGESETDKYAKYYQLLLVSVTVTPPSLMGSLAHHRAQNRVRTALTQRLDAAPADEHTVHYDETIERLLRIALDAEELNRVAHELALDPTEIDWPSDTHDTHP
jgi:hypothetical protein